MYSSNRNHWCITLIFTIICDFMKIYLLKAPKNCRVSQIFADILNDSKMLSELSPKTYRTYVFGHVTIFWKYYQRGGGRLKRKMSKILPIHLSHLNVLTIRSRGCITLIFSIFCNFSEISPLKTLKNCRALQILANSLIQSKMQFRINPIKTQ